VDSREPWFVASDARAALGLVDAGSCYSALDDDEKQAATKDLVRGLNTRKDSYTHGGAIKRALLISESGLYKLIMWNDKPQARPFQDWVTHEVLPSIRKTGSFKLEKGEVMRFRPASPTPRASGD
jgi:prophage antirepressor-like protein